jgi:hypothetical protein
MNRTRRIKTTALLLTLIYLWLSGSIMIGAENHAVRHAHSANHSAQHSSFVCTWMCASSSFVHSSDHSLSRTPLPAEPNAAGIAQRPFDNRSVFNFRTRPPPAVL